jgi:hypothetical protein
MKVQNKESSNITLLLHIQETTVTAGSVEVAVSRNPHPTPTTVIKWMVTERTTCIRLLSEAEFSLHYQV